MKTIVFATTQMNLINCVEYLYTINGDNLLVILADSQSRQKQLESFLEKRAYRQMFSKVLYRYVTNNRFINFISTCLFFIKLRYISSNNIFDKIITGNYKSYAPRFIFRLQKQKVSNCQLIVCDDGLATNTIASMRLLEIKTRSPYMFFPNRLERFIYCKRKDQFIPDNICYFTIYNIPLADSDTKLINNYSYVKLNLSEFDVDKAKFDCSAIFLGQPLYCKGYMSVENYAKKLIHYAETVHGRIVYYAHPEEKKEIWDKLRLDGKYEYVNNSLPFEIISTFLPVGCRISGFMTSVLMNLKSINDSLIGECIKIKSDDLLNKNVFGSLLEAYEHYKKNGIVFYEFD